MTTAEGKGAGGGFDTCGIALPVVPEAEEKTLIDIVRRGHYGTME